MFLLFYYITVDSIHENFTHEFSFLEPSAKFCPVKIPRYTVCTYSHCIGYDCTTTTGFSVALLCLHRLFYPLQLLPTNNCVGMWLRGQKQQGPEQQQGHKGIPLGHRAAGCSHHSGSG